MTSTLEVAPLIRAAYVMESTGVSTSSTAMVNSKFGSAKRRSKSSDSAKPCVEITSVGGSSTAAMVTSKGNCASASSARTVTRNVSTPFASFTGSYVNPASLTLRDPRSGASLTTKVTGVNGSLLLVKPSMGALTAISSSVTSGVTPAGESTSLGSTSTDTTAE